MNIDFLSYVTHLSCKISLTRDGELLVDGILNNVAVTSVKWLPFLRLHPGLLPLRWTVRTPRDNSGVTQSFQKLVFRFLEVEVYGRRRVGGRRSTLYLEGLGTSVHPDVGNLYVREFGTG